MHLSRRRFLALSASLTVGACASSDGDETTGTSPATDPPATTPPTTAPAATTSTSTSTVAATSTTTTTATTLEPSVVLDADPFAFGVASGDPDDTSVVLWTRLDGDLPADGIDVAWSFVGDDGTEVSGTARTDSATGFTVHALADVTGPGTFVFEAGGFTSPAGRTAPIDATTSEFRIAAAACQNYESGFYAAHRDIAEWQPDLVVFLGDFIYEGFSPALGDTIVRLHDPFEPMDLDGYRARYAQYLRDPQLQASRAAAPWLAIWDDHEVENNYAGLVSQDDVDPAEFAVRRAQAYQVWWENTPTRLAPPDLADDPTQPYAIYRGLDVGELLRISALDGRQFRDDQLSDATLDPGPPVAGWDDPSRSMLGAEQEAWAIDRFATSEATWNCLAQQTVFGDTRLGEVGAILNYDQWDGYAAARDRLLVAAPPNFVTITGDIHLAGVGEIFDDGETTGIEFVTTGISSGQNVDPALAEVVKSIPAIVDAELEFRGYTRHTISADVWRAEYRQVVVIGDPDSEVRTWKTFEVPAGSPTVTEA